MGEVVGGRVPGWFRLLSVLALVWSLFGVAMYLMHVGLFGDPTGGLSEAERALAESTPTWVTGAFAVATFAAALGTLGLVLLRRWARLLLLISLAAVIVQEGWILFMSDAREVHGLSAVAMPLLITLVGVLLVWLASSGIRRGWLR